MFLKRESKIMILTLLTYNLIISLFSLSTSRGIKTMEQESQNEAQCHPFESTCEIKHEREGPWRVTQRETIDK